MPASLRPQKLAIHSGILFGSQCAFIILLNSLQHLKNGEILQKNWDLEFLLKKIFSVAKLALNFFFSFKVSLIDILIKVSHEQYCGY